MSIDCRRIAFVSRLMLASNLVAARVSAEPARPDVVLDHETSACGGADVLRARVAERLGRDPFVSASGSGFARTLRVRTGGGPGAWSATIDWIDASGDVVGSRSLRDAAPSCEPILRSIVLTIAVLLEDPAPLPGGASPEPARPAPARDEASVHPRSEPTPPPARVATGVDAFVGGRVLVGSAPAASLAAELGVGVERARYRLELSGLATLPASGEGPVAVRARTVALRAAPCYGVSALAGCVVALVGSISGEATGTDSTGARLGGALFAGAGFAVLSRVPLGEIVFGRLALDGWTPLTRVGFDVGDRRVFTLPWLAGSVTVAVGARLP